jgi:predicted SAM-dependent methyltransferase
MQVPVKLELGAGHRPTRGYVHNDLHPGPHIEHVGEAWMLDLPDNSCDEILAVAFIEHLTYNQALDTFRNVHRMLKPGGLFLFDVPDYPVWVGYYLDHRIGEECPVTLDHVRRTLFGWGRFPGDSHLYGWDEEHLYEALTDCGFFAPRLDVEQFKIRMHRDRFDNPADAHIYVIARPEK